MKSILAYFKPYKKMILAAVPLYAVSTVAALLMPFFMSNIVNRGIAEQNIPYIIKEGAIMLSLSLAGVVSALFAARINTKISAGFSESLFKGVFGKISTFSMEEFLKHGTSGLLTRSTHDVYVMHELAANIVSIGVRMPILFLGGIVLSVIKDYVLALIFFAAAPAVFFVVWLISRKMNELWERADKYIDDQNKIVRERLSGIRVIRAFDREDHEHERMAAATRKMAKNIIRANVLSGSVMPSVTFFFNLAIIVVLFIGSTRLTPGGMLTAGDILATVQYISLVMYGCIMLTFGIIFLPQIKVSAKRISEIFNTKGDLPTEETAETLPGDITFDNVTFAYPGSAAPSLENISFKIKRGETVAIIGGTGSGKTTVARLLTRLYNATSGEITLGGKSYSGEVNRETARKNISIVMQKGMIFQASIGENIRLGNLGATDEEICSAAEDAQLLSYVEKLDDKFNHMLSQGGTNISGGQGQRVNIARALVKDASVYIFDDSFSNLDFMTEANLREALNKRLKGKTRLIITQRAATAMHCDRIIVLDSGRLDGVGTHEQLLKNSAIYAEICRSQMG